jgi:hypothetical protein
MIWGQIEVSFGLICVSLPAIDFILVKLIPTRLRQFLKKHLHRAEENDLELSEEDIKKSQIEVAKVNFGNNLDPKKLTSTNGFRTVVETVDPRQVLGDANGGTFACKKSGWTRLTDYSQLPSTNIVRTTREVRIESSDY